MIDVKNISIEEYNYALPDERIAPKPLEQRDASKLLVYQNGNIEETVFNQIDNFLPEKSLLVLNNTRVINARLVFAKDTGARIEIFCLEPFGKINEYVTVMSATGSSMWKCLIGGAAKWKEGLLRKKLFLNDTEVILRAEKADRSKEDFTVRFSWMPAHHSFAEIVEAAGAVPLPPYIKRVAEEEDKNRYQTIYAAHQGSVAAPTAGLHFTQDVFDKLEAKGIGRAQVTLHVGAGTFKPVSAGNMGAHIMHEEYIDVQAATIQQIIANNFIIAAGTTTCRTLETLYWLGVKALIHREATVLSLSQWDVYESEIAAANFSKQEALTALLAWMKKYERNSIFTKTQLLIAPGYRFRVVNALVTNFHQPKSTLLLLVAAAVGEDWKKLYDYALDNDFRFLSYGDSNLIFL